MAFVTEYDKGKTVTHPFSNDTVVMFVQGYVTVFLCLCDSVSKERHKATTPNCVPQEKDTCEGAVCKLALCLVCWSLKYSCYINSSSGKSDFIMYIFMVMAEGLFCLCVSRLIERDI